MFNYGTLEINTMKKLIILGICCVAISTSKAQELKVKWIENDPKEIWLSISDTSYVDVIVILKDQAISAKMRVIKAECDHGKYKGRSFEISRNFFIDNRKIIPQAWMKKEHYLQTDITWGDIQWIQNNSK